MNTITPPTKSRVVAIQLDNTGKRLMDSDGGRVWVVKR